MNLAVSLVEIVAGQSVQYKGETMIVSTSDFLLLYTTSGNRRSETIIHRDDIISVKPSINPEYIDIILDDDTIICVDAEYLETINNIIKERQ